MWSASNTVSSSRMPKLDMSHRSVHLGITGFGGRVCRRTYHFPPGSPHTCSSYRCCYQTRETCRDLAYREGSLQKNGGISPVFGAVTVKLRNYPQMMHEHSSWHAATQNYAETFIERTTSLAVSQLISSWPPSRALL